MAQEQEIEFLVRSANPTKGSSKRKSVLITGCSTGGIGHALAKYYHAKGLWVFATARRVETMKDLAILGITTMALEVTDIENICKVRDEVAALTGDKLDILVNNAGQAYWAPVADCNMDRVRNLFEVNVFAPIAMTKEFLPLLIASGDGRVVQLGSVSSVAPLPYIAAYAASKAALAALGNTLRNELSPFNVKVVNVLAGGVQSNIRRPITPLPENSLYKAVERLQHEGKLHDPLSNAVETDVFAKIVADESLKASPNSWLWTGKSSWTVWFIHTFFGPRGFDWFVGKYFGLSDVALDFKNSQAKSKSD